jgi:phage terminase Nu1 subunit (DNA packaging protein)
LIKHEFHSWFCKKDAKITKGRNKQSQRAKNETQEDYKMTIAKEYFEQQLKNSEFKLHYLNEKEKLDIEYMLEELKKDIINKKPTNVLISEIENLEKILIKSGS